MRSCNPLNIVLIEHLLGKKDPGRNFLGKTSTTKILLQEESLFLFAYTAVWGGEPCNKASTEAVTL